MRWWRAAAVCALCIAMGGADVAANAPAPTGGHMRIAVPLYVDPGPAWAQTIDARSVGLVVMNPDSGPGAGFDPSYAQAVRDAQAKGVRVVGYVATGYGKDGLRKVEGQIADYYAWYRVDGIFLDETPYACDQHLVRYYTELRDAIVHHSRAAHSAHAMVVMNPGTVPAGDCYMSIADVLVTYEDNAHVYTATSGNHYATAAWLSHYPARRFWHIVYGVPNAAAMRRVLSRAAKRGAGWVYVTNLRLPNPYGALPSYWAAEAAAAK